MLNAERQPRALTRWPRPPSRCTRTTSPPDCLSGTAVAVDTETLGLNVNRDRLCLVQLSSGDGTAHLVQFDGHDYAAPNLKALLTDPAVLKIFHYARFDIAVLEKNLGVVTAPIYCTKIASKLVRTYTDRHGLKDLVGELVGIELSKQQQSSDWASSELSQQQLAYAASDVLHLHALKAQARRHAGARGPHGSSRRPHSGFSPRAPSSIWPALARTTFSRIEVSGGCRLQAVDFSGRSAPRRRGFAPPAQSQYNPN